MSHLTHAQRTLIENGLRDHKSFKEIARDIGKAHTTVSREVRKHYVTSDKGAYGRVTNRCIYRRECKRLNVCGDLRCRRRCSVCAKCNEICPDFHEDICTWLNQSPYVCNGCPDEHRSCCGKNIIFTIRPRSNTERCCLTSEPEPPSMRRSDWRSE